MIRRADAPKGGLKEAATIETDVGRRFYGATSAAARPALRTAARQSRTSRPMPKKPGTNPKGEFALFNVVRRQRPKQP